MIEQRTPRACGAIGAYERARVDAVAAALGARTTVRHEAPDSILACNVEPLRWRGPDGEGWAWSDDGLRREAPNADSWETAAYEMSAAGLAVPEAGEAHLHSSVSGCGPVYWFDDGKAAYFSSSIDSLLAAYDGPLSPDWTAWSSIFCFGFPLGEELTPFREVRRIPPCSVLRRAAGGAVVEMQRWPWAEQDPVLDAAPAARAIHERLVAEAARLDGAGIAFPLSGGLDSRLLLGVISKRHPELQRTTTVNADSGTDREERLARAVAESLGYEHVMAPVDGSAYAADFAERARLVDYQWQSHPWMLPLGRALAGEGAIAPHGLPMNAMLERDPAHAGSAILGDGRKVGRAIFRSMAPARKLSLFEDDAGETMRGAARGEALAMADRYDGHPMRPALLHLRARSVRGVALGPVDTLGNFIPVAAPFLAGPLGTACMSAAPAAKDDLKLYEALFSEIDERLWRLPSTRDPKQAQAPRSARRAEPDAVRVVCEAALRAPLAGRLTDVASLKLERNDPDLLLGGPQRKQLFALAMMGLWFERYSTRLGEIDPGEFA